MNTIRVQCLNCSTTFEKNAGEVRRSKNHFCTRSCAATYNNKLYPKRRGSHVNRCPDCDGPKSYNSKRCHNCKRRANAIKTGDRTIGEVILTGYKSSSKYSSIRQHAHVMTTLFYDIPKTCSLCQVPEFDKVVELTHIIPIADFRHSVRLIEVNARENLEYLCPSHHRMVDGGFISRNNGR